MSDLELLAVKIYHTIRVHKANVLVDGKLTLNTDPRPDLKEQYSEGLLPISELRHGAYYLGHCRNASVARWDATRSMFRHVRHKFGSSYEEDVNHPANDVGFDIFVPVCVTEPTPDQTVREGFDD